MVYYSADEIISAAASTGLMPEAFSGNLSKMVPTGDTFDILKLKKQAPLKGPAG
jgi:hypothetical protein